MFVILYEKEVSYKLMNSLKRKFIDFLIEQGYKERTNSGKPSTVYDYPKRIDFVCEIENYTWDILAQEIDFIIELYAAEGIKAELGAKSHNAVISALKQFKIFITKENLLNNNSTSQKNKQSNQFLKEILYKEGISFIEKGNSFYEITISNEIYLLKCRTYNKNYTFIAKSEIPNLSKNTMVALVEWISDKPSNLYFIPMSEWQNPDLTMLKDRDYEGLKSKPEWGIDINQTNRNELKKFLANKIIKSIKEKEENKIIEELENNELNAYNETEKQALIKIRIGHSKLRNKILNYKKECEICGIKNSKLLVISHIKPWAKSENTEKLDEHNILLLCSMHDALFDKGLISFDDDGKILISSELDEQEQALVNINSDSCINIFSDKQKAFLKYHRENKFIK